MGPRWAAGPLQPDVKGDPRNAGQRGRRVHVIDTLMWLARTAGSVEIIDVAVLGVVGRRDIQTPAASVVGNVDVEVSVGMSGAVLAS